MHYTEALAAIAALSTLANASPVVPTVSKLRSTFSIQQAATGKMVPRSGPAEYRKALAKYGATPPSNVIAAAEALQSGSVTANPTSYDAEYLSPVSVGGQTLMLDFDTGSADLWCFSTELPSDESNGQTEYDPSTSGQQMSGASWQISYGDGSGASGDVYADTVVIGGVTATGQAVEAATSVSSQFASNSANDGLVGFAFSTINTVSPQQQNTWFDTVKDSLPDQIFAVTLKYNQAGTYDFGYIDSSKYTGDISYVDVDSSNGFWEFTADGYSVSGQSASQSFDAIADTGTTLILIDDSIAQAYYSAVSGAQNSNSAGGYVFDCSASLPDFSLSIGGGSFVVPGQYINFAPNGDGTCYGGIQSSAGIGFNILGDVFLKNQYVVFDAGKNQLGFASQTGGGSSNSTAKLLRPRWIAKPTEVLSRAF